jgi:lysophospholipase L1-like esterase
VTKLYANAVFAVGKQLDVPVVDSYYSMQRVSGWQQSFMKKDGLHLTPAGNMFLAQQVLNGINTHYKHLR